MADKEIDISDIPTLDTTFFANAKLRLPKGKVPVVLSVDADVIERFKAQGDEYPKLLNAALRIYVEAPEEKNH